MTLPTKLVGAFVLSALVTLFVGGNTGKPQ